MGIVKRDPGKDDPQDFVQSWLERTAGPRWREVEAHANKRGITLGEAIIELINLGLLLSSPVIRFPIDQQRLVISALSKLILEESPLSSVAETIESCLPVGNPLTSQELRAVREYFADA